MPEERFLLLDSPISQDSNETALRFAQERKPPPSTHESIPGMAMADDAAATFSNNGGRLPVPSC